MKKKYLSFILVAGLVLSGLFSVENNLYASNDNLSLEKEVDNRTGVVTGSVNIKGTQFNWMETRYGATGGGNRGILFNPGNHQYRISPNPHNNPAYNRPGGANSFYNTIGNTVAERMNRQTGANPVWQQHHGAIRWEGINYYLDLER